MSKLAKQPEEATWEGRWAQAVARSLQQLEVHSEGVLASGDEDDDLLAKLDEELCNHVLEGLGQPLDTFHDALNRLGEELSRHGIEKAYDRFTSYLNEAAQTVQWEHEVPTAQGLRHEGGRSSLFGLGLLMLSTCSHVAQSWGTTSNERIADLMVQHRHVSPRGRVVLMPVGLNTQETVDLEPWMGYRLTALLQDWAAANPAGHPDVAQARAMLQDAGLDVAAHLLGPGSGTGPRTKYLRHLTLLGLHVPLPEDLLAVDEDADIQDELDYDFPLANFAAGLADGGRELEDVLLALALRQGSSMLGSSEEQAQAMSQRFSTWTLAGLEAEATGLSAEMDGLRAAHPDLAAAQRIEGFAQGTFAQELSALLASDLVPSDEELAVQPAWPATFVFEATDEGLKAYRDLSFRARASIAAAQAGLEQADKLVASIDHDTGKREFQVLFQLPAHSQVAGFATWAILPWEGVDESLKELRQTLQSLGVSPIRADKGGRGRLH